MFQHMLLLCHKRISPCFQLCVYRVKDAFEKFGEKKLELLQKSLKKLGLLSSAPQIFKMENAGVVASKRLNLLPLLVDQDAYNLFLFSIFKVFVVIVSNQFFGLTQGYPDMMIKRCQEVQIKICLNHTAFHDYILSTGCSQSKSMQPETKFIK